MIYIKKLLLISMLGVGIIGCDRTTTPCLYLIPESADIPVGVDWGGSGVTGAHRLSLRFYPEDGGVVFERYLEGNLTTGEIEVPVGRYSVVAMNESVGDRYWDGALRFTNIDDYDLFAAELVAYGDGVEEANEPYPLAAWSLGAFEVTSDMAVYSKRVMGVGDNLIVKQLTDYEDIQMNALTHIVLTPRTRKLRIEVDTENLVSLLSMEARVTGLSRSVEMVSGEAAQDPVSHTLQLESWEFGTSQVPGDNHGIASGERYCLGHAKEVLETRAAGDYTLDLETYLTDGTKYDDETLSGVDVEDQVTSTSDDSDYLIQHTIRLPEVESDVSVDGWGDGGDIELN